MISHPKPESAIAWIWRLSARAVSLFLLAAIRAYQLVFAPVLPLVLGPGCGCRFHPTCSHYAQEAVRCHGPLTGTWLALKRIARCQPFHPGGVDFVPPAVSSSPVRVCRAVPTAASSLPFDASSTQS